LLLTALISFFSLTRIAPPGTLRLIGLIRVLVLSFDDPRMFWSAEAAFLDALSGVWKVV
jgi:hypothetical protein